jgi:hypothetical protein
VSENPSAEALYLKHPINVRASHPFDLGVLYRIRLRLFQARKEQNQPAPFYALCLWLWWLPEK